MNAKKQRSMAAPGDREAIKATMRRFYDDPRNGAIRAVNEFVNAFDFSVDPPRQMTQISLYALRRIASAFKNYLNGKDHLKGEESLDEAFGFRGKGRGARSAAEKCRRAQKQYEVVYDFLSARDEGRSYEEALACVAKAHGISAETIKRLVKK
jgi:hypothetical protein